MHILRIIIIVLIFHFILILFGFDFDFDFFTDFKEIDEGKKEFMLINKETE